MSSTGCLPLPNQRRCPQPQSTRNGWCRSRFSSDGCLPHRKSPRQPNGGTWHMEISEITYLSIYPYYPYSLLPLVSYARLCWNFVGVEGQGSTKLDASTIFSLLAGQVSGKFCVLWLKCGGMRWQNCVSQCLISRHMRIVSMQNLQTPTIHIFLAGLTAKALKTHKSHNPLHEEHHKSTQPKTLGPNLDNLFLHCSQDMFFFDFAAAESWHVSWHVAKTFSWGVEGTPNIPKHWNSVDCACHEHECDECRCASL